MEKKLNYSDHWLWFYRKMLLPINLVITAILFLFALISMTAGPLYIVDTIIQAYFLGLIAVTYINMKQLNEKAYGYNMVLLWSLFIVNVLMSAISVIFFDQGIGSLLGVTIFYGLYSILNLIYFKKRKAIFYDDEVRNIYKV